MFHRASLISMALLSSLTLTSVSGGKSAPQSGSGHLPPSQAAASMTPGEGACIRFISVFVPAGGGNYVVGVSFAFRDLNQDGTYTPGVDRLQVCVNCADACDWGP